MRIAKLTNIGFCAFIAYHINLAQAEENNNILDMINVSGESDISNKKIAQTTKSTKTLTKQQVQDNRDLVRYETGITTIDAGRFGNSGFAIRGVDENRVAINIDGLKQAETISSQGFKELFEGYGNFNNTRNSAEIETLKQVTISKGVDSLKSGSGALGGSVSFETKDARDYLSNKNYFLSYKRGYSSADRQNLNTLTVAGRYKWFDILLVQTNRNSHEFENYGYKNYDDQIQGKQREKADPYHRTLESTLLKLSFQPTENHRFTAVADLYKTRSRGHDFSYTLKFSKYGVDRAEQELRHTDDRVKRKNYAFVYENYSANPLWDTLKLSYSQQNISTIARTDDYCDGNDQCPTAKNLLGMKYNAHNQLVGEDNQTARYIDTSHQPPQAGAEEMVTIPVEAYNGTNSIYRWERANWESIADKYEITYRYCEEDFSRWTNRPTVGDQQPCVAKLKPKAKQIPLEKSFTINGVTHNLLTQPDAISDNQILRTNTPLLLSCEGINCNKKSITAYNIDGTEIVLPFTVIERNNKKFALIDKQGNDQLKTPMIFVPNKPGYTPNLWKERTLNSRTKQLNLDLTKFFTLGETEHNFSYGLLWSQTLKEMINTSGASALNTKWWASYPIDCSGDLSNPDRHNQLCNNSNTYSFLIPVKTDTKSLYFVNNMQLNSYVGISVGYRYDRIYHKPHYEPGVTPKIPDDMVTNLYVKSPSFNSSDYTTPENQALRRENAIANIEQIAQNRKFSASSYNLEATIDPTSYLRLQAKYSKGFRAPASDEIYFTFKHPDFSILPNKDLQSETAKTKEIALTLHEKFGFITASLFQTQYANFIDLAFKGRQHFEGGQMGYLIYQNVNRTNAKVNGIEIQSKLDLSLLWKKLADFNLSYKYTYQKGRMDEHIPMNAIQPRTAIYGLHYQHPDDRFGVDLYITHVSSKKTKDTYNMYYKEEGKKDDSIKWRSNAYTLIDLISYVKPIENLTLRMGIYNLTNRKYLTWESARSIRPFGTSNMINQETGLGINRFYAPGRNFKLSAELTF